jgi:tetratricopeptide (TPR) repeat protein
MSQTPHEVQLPLSEFDRNQLPESKRHLQGDDFRLAVQEHLAEQFVGQQGAAEVVVTSDRIIIRWSNASQAQDLTELGIESLKQGDLEKGIGTLRVALQRNPGDEAALFNLGMALTETGRPEEAVAVLQRLLDSSPSDASAWVALGVAQAGLNQLESAIDSFETAVALNPQNGHAQKNLGAMLAQSESTFQQALEHLRLAVKLLPGDAQAWLNLGTCLEKSGQNEQADQAYVKVLELDRKSQLGMKAEEGRTRIAQVNFRSHGGALRPDALAYCLGALQFFDGMPRTEIQKISFEIAMLGARGLQVDDPADQYSLQSISGKFSGLHLLCIAYVGFQLIDPSVDLGFDLSAEYAEASRLHGAA